MTTLRSPNPWTIGRQTYLTLQLPESASRLAELKHLQVLQGSSELADLCRQRGETSGQRGTTCFSLVAEGMAGGGGAFLAPPKADKFASSEKITPRKERRENRELRRHLWGAGGGMGPLSRTVRAFRPERPAHGAQETSLKSGRALGLSRGCTDNTKGGVGDEHAALVVPFLNHVNSP